MGSVTLKKKKDLNYRSGYTSRSCGDCNHIIRDFAVRTVDGEFKKTESRCHIMGPYNGRAFRISPNNICDAFDNSQLLKRLGVDTTQELKAVAER